MKVLVNGVRLYFDVEGAGLVPEGESMRARPTLLLLHGGPGADHSLYKPAFAALAGVAQVVYLDHRGNGRSESGGESTWTLAQWADDARELCNVLGIEKPVVYGASFGGMVALAYATRYPDHPGKLILVSTTAQAASHTQAKVEMFARLGGPEARRLAERRLVEGDTSARMIDEWLRVMFPLYTRKAQNPAGVRRVARNAAVTAWFNRPGGEGRNFDLLPELKRIRCPTLVLGGTLDPMIPIECQRDIAAGIRPELLRYREFADCGHGVVPDYPEEAMALIREFIQAAG